MPIPRDIIDVLRYNDQALRETVHTSLPGKVLTFYPSTQTADIHITVQRPILSPIDGSKTYEAFPDLPQVPIAYPRGGGFCMAFPLSAGDEVTVVFRMYGDSEWKANAQDSQPVDMTVHGLYCVAMPCSTTAANVLADPVSSDLVIGRAGQNEQIRIPAAGGEIDLGAAPTDFIALCTKIDSLITLLVTPIAPAGVETGFASLQSALLTWKTANWTASTTTGASLVKAQ